jgi:hypothetical protein
MDKVVVDPTVLASLGGIGHSVELCDPSGRSVGIFVPLTDAVDYEGYECPLSKEELDEIERAGGGRPLAEILRDLERMA